MELSASSLDDTGTQPNRLLTLAPIWYPIKGILIHDRHSGGASRSDRLKRCRGSSHGPRRHDRRGQYLGHDRTRSNREQPRLDGLEKAQVMTNNESPPTTKLYDRKRDQITLDEI